MKITDFQPAVPLMEEVGAQIASWKNSAELRFLHSEVDFKTEADQRAHGLISEGLSCLYPGVAIISEESKAFPGARPDRYWLIDPIDGTASWYHGFSGYVTQAAYIENGVPLFGIIHAPLMKRTWTALRGGGAFLDGSPLRMLASCDRLVIADNTPKPHGIARDMVVALQATGYVESGSLGLKSVLVADGTIDLFVKDVCVRDWDVAPAAVILREVGGHLLLSNGSQYVFDGAFEKPGGFIVARDSDLMQRALQVFARVSDGGSK
ncbi:inositol monophosphatase family protein [Castellaniella sp.]|uniref:inositol monophosphatase family protein n=1 Tax=Castellaniella sp. TaxID=1955812 RepID=UPI003A9450F1